MSEIKLFNIKDKVVELTSSSVALERELQNIIENNMLEIFGVRFIKSEYKIKGGTIDGRMDSIGIDEDNSPVIFEYKKGSNDNVINQGLYYLTWLLEHKADFKLLVLEKFGTELAEQIDWTMPRVICIASDFNKYDEEAIKQINRKITLIRYKKYNSDLLLFELLNTNKVDPIIEDAKPAKRKTSSNVVDKTFAEQLNSAPKKIVDLYNELRDFALDLGDDVSENTLKLYTAFKKIKNFSTIEVYHTKLIIHFKLNPDEYELDTNLRDMREIGHWGSGDLQLILSNKNDIDRAKKLLNEAYIKN